MVPFPRNLFSSICDFSPAHLTDLRRIWVWIYRTHTPNSLKSLCVLQVPKEEKMAQWRWRALSLGLVFTSQGTLWPPQLPGVIWMFFLPFRLFMPTSLMPLLLLIHISFANCSKEHRFGSFQRDYSSICQRQQFFIFIFLKKNHLTRKISGM